MYRIIINYIVRDKIESLSLENKTIVDKALKNIGKFGINQINVKKLSGTQMNLFTYRASPVIRVLFEVLDTEIRIVDIVFRDTLDYFRNSFQGVER